MKFPRPPALRTQLRPAAAHVNEHLRSQGVRFVLWISMGVSGSLTALIGAGIAYVVWPFFHNWSYASIAFGIWIMICFFAGMSLGRRSGRLIVRDVLEQSKKIF